MGTTFRTGLALCVAALALGACIEPPTAPRSQCTPVPFEPASVSGDTITTTTGLRYLEGAAGEGLALDWCDVVAVHYTGYLLDGTKFDSSRDIATPLVFTPGDGLLIDGFEQGVIGMRIGGTRRLVISPALGFGSEPRYNEDGEIVVPGNSTLVYDIEVLGIALQ